MPDSVGEVFTGLWSPQITGVIERVGAVYGIAEPTETTAPVESATPPVDTTLASTTTPVVIDFSDQGDIVFASVIRVLFDDDDVAEVGAEVVYWHGDYYPPYAIYSTEELDPEDGVRLRLSIRPQNGWEPGRRLVLRTTSVDSAGNVS